MTLLRCRVRDTGVLDALVFCATVAGTVACSSPGADDVPQVGDVVDPLTVCGRLGPVVLAKEDLSNIGTSVTTYVCPSSPSGAPKVVSVDDSTAEVVDLGGLRLEEYGVFRSGRNLLDPAFDEIFTADSEQQVRAHVWFRAPSAPAPLPTKEELLTDKRYAERVDAQRKNATRAAAASMSERLSAIPGLRILSDPARSSEYDAPYVVVEGTEGALRQAGEARDVWRIMPAVEDQQVFNSDYYYTLNAGWLDFVGADGTGLVVANLEAAFPDSTANLVTQPGSCTPQVGSSFKCHCPGPAGQFSDPHPRQMMGVVRSPVLSFGGIADETTTISANWFGGCTSHGPDEYSSAVLWARDNGASVLLQPSRYYGTANPQNTGDYLLDWVGFNWPYITTVASGGQTPTGALGRSANNLRNGLVVGLGYENAGSDRSQVGFWYWSWWFNYNQAVGMEMPHVVAIGANSGNGVDTAGKQSGQVDLTGGTSASAAQVAGLVADLMELNPTLQSWPELVVPGVIVSSNRITWDYYWLNLHDSIDDLDGAGLVNAFDALLTLQPSAYVWDANPPARYGHANGSMNPSNTPEQTFYARSWNAQVPPNEVLRVSAMVPSQPTCPGYPPTGPCTGAPYPNIGLFVYEGPTLVRASLSAENNYQYVAMENTTGSTKTYNIKLIMFKWNGLSSSSFGVAWASSMKD